MGTVYEIVFYLFCRTFFLYKFDLTKENTEISNFETCLIESG